MTDSPDRVTKSSGPRRSTRIQGRVTPMSTDNTLPDPRDLLEAAETLRSGSRASRGSRRPRKVAFVTDAQQQQNRTDGKEQNLQENSTRLPAPPGEAGLPTPPASDLTGHHRHHPPQRVNDVEAQRSQLQSSRNRLLAQTLADRPSDAWSPAGDQPGPASPPQRKNEPVQTPTASGVAGSSRRQFQPVAGVKRARFDLHDHHRHDSHHHDHHHAHQQDGDRGDGDKSTTRLRDNQGRAIGVSQQLPQDPMVYMLSQLGDYPEPLELEHISSMFRIIQERIFGPSSDIGGAGGMTKSFVEKHFDFILTDAQCAAWPLHELKTKYVPLFLTAQYLADGSQYGWRNFFTQPQYRQHLVGAILGEWFTQRIFKHTAFGMPQDILHELEEVDREYLRHDAVVRTKKRGQLLDAKYKDHRLRPSIQESVRHTAERLAEEMMVVLYPLLPPPVFDPLDPTAKLCKTNPIRKQVEEVSSKIRGEIQRDLLNLILDCSTLHTCIRISGKDSGTVVRVVPHLSKGSRFHPTAPMDCVNQQWCNQSIPLNPAEPSELCIKLTSWPRIEAIVPHGPDMADLSAWETQYRKRDRDDVRVTRSGEDTVEVAADASADADASAAVPEFSWDKYEHLWPVVPDDLQDREGRQALAGITTSEDGLTNTLKRATYVTVYPSICHAKVYCEWTPQPAGRGQTLSAAVHEARRKSAGSAYTKHRVEDLQIEMWNAWAWYGGLAQWGVIAVSLVASLSHGLNVPSYVNLALWKVLNNVKLVQNRVEVEQVREYLTDVFKELVAPVNALTTNPLQRVSKFLAKTSTLAEATLSRSPRRGDAILQTVKDAITEDVRRVLGATPAMVAATTTVTSAATLSAPGRSDALPDLGTELDQDVSGATADEIGLGDMFEFEYEIMTASDEAEPNAEYLFHPDETDEDRRHEASTVASNTASSRRRGWISRSWGNR